MALRVQLLLAVVAFLASRQPDPVALSMSMPISISVPATMALTLASGVGASEGSPYYVPGTDAGTRTGSRSRSRKGKVFASNSKQKRKGFMKWFQNIGGQATDIALEQVRVCMP